jgi:uncharacterized protein YndB with AHSA1/START domain
VPVLGSTIDSENLTLTFTAEFSSPIERVWQVWADPRQLERWWGPPTWPATFGRFEFSVGGRADYFMTGPDGTTAHGWWKFTAIDEPTLLALEDGFANADGTPIDESDTTSTVANLEPIEAGTLMTVTATFKDLEQLEKLVRMGMQEGMASAMGQLDAVLAGA